jgi:hypothetical protein
LHSSTVSRPGQSGILVLFGKRFFKQKRRVSGMFIDYLSYVLFASFKSLLGFKEGAFLYSNPQLVLSIINWSRVFFFVQVDTCLD